MKLCCSLIFLFSVMVPTSISHAEEGGFASFLEEREKQKENRAESPKKSTAAGKKKKKNNNAIGLVPAKSSETADAGERSTATNSISAPSEEPAPSAPSNMTAEQRLHLSTFVVKTNKNCLVTEVATLPNGELSCSEAAPMRYTLRDCGSGSIKEIGETEAQASCPDRNRIELRFRTSSDAIVMAMRATRQTEGRAGTTTGYTVVSANEEESSLTKFLTIPNLISPSGEKAEESPLKLTFSGFATVEWENTRNFGFDGASLQQNFNSRARQARQSNFNFLTNFGFEAARDKTSLVSIFEIGEVYFGNTASGGAVGARANNIFEVRNLYLNHGFSENISLKGGIVPTASDPRSFIFSDHVSSIQATYSTDLSQGLIWFAEGARHRPGAPHLRDQYAGLMGTLGFLSGPKVTVFGINRTKDSDEILANDNSGNVLSGSSRYVWAGATLETELMPTLSIQGTAIQNWVSTKFTGGKDSFNGHLLDLRLTKKWSDSIFVTTLEGLVTSGAKGVTDATSGKQIRGKRANFVSPIAAAYLLSIATSDGVDDSPGTPKESIIGNLNLDEGLQIAVLGVTANVTRKASVLFRYGHLKAGNGSVATGKTHIGDEVDLGLLYQLTPSTSLQLDYAFFMPGNFYATSATARLTAAKMKFSF